MEIVIKRFDMKRILFLILCFSLVEAKDISTREYNAIDEQLAYNVIKRIFVSDDSETIVDTNWSTLHVSKRSTTGFVDITTSVDNILLTTKYNSERDSKKISLEIFTTVDEENSYVSSESFLHTLAWNRVEYALGFDDNWIECIYSPRGIFYINHPLCSVNKENFELEK